VTTTVNQSSAVNGSLYNWTQATYSWNDPRSKRPWNTFAPLLYTNAIGETACTIEVATDTVQHLMAIAEGFATSVAFENAVVRGNSESFSTSELFPRSFTKNVAEGFTAPALVVANQVSKKFSEGFASADSRGTVWAHANAEGFTTTETHSRIITHKASEAFTTTEAIGKGFTKWLTEAFTTTGALAKSVARASSETFNTSASGVDITGWHLAPNESWAITDALKNAVTQGAFSASVATSVSLGNSITKPVSEAFGTSEASSHAAAFYRNVAVTIGTADSSNRQYLQTFADSVEVADGMLRNVNTVLYDVNTKNAAYTIAQMRAWALNSSPLGYAAPSQLVPGDYTYQKAIVGVQLSAQSAQVLPALTALLFNVDVPTISYDGVNYIPAEATWISFPSPFNNPVSDPPKVSGQQQGGTTVVLVQITGVTSSGFWVTLVNASNTSELMPGTIVWWANGY